MSKTLFREVPGFNTNYFDRHLYRRRIFHNGGRMSGSMKTVYDFFVSGLPKPQPRPRMTKTGHVYTPDSAKAWKEAVTAVCLSKRQPVITAPVKLTVYFYFPPPKRVKLQAGGYYPHVSKPDIDNLLKAVMDAMTEANIWTDDAPVYSSHAEKWVYNAPSGARIKVEVREERICSFYSGQ